MSQEIKSLEVAITSVTADIQSIKESTARRMKIESDVNLLRIQDKERRIDLAIANAESHPLLDCDSYAVLEVPHFYRITLDGREGGSFDCRRFISVALSMFRINSGISIPTDVVYGKPRAPPPIEHEDYDPYNPHRHIRSRHQSSSTLKQDDRQSFSKLNQDERQAKLLKFQTTIMNYFHSLLGFKPRIETDEQGNMMMFYD
jgi:hypothetical protein